MDQEAIIRSIVASLPEITVLGAACLLLMLDLVFKRKRVALIGYLSLAVVVIAALETWLLVLPGEAVYSGMFIADSFSAFFKMIFYLATALCILASINYIRIEEIQHSEYYVLLLFALCGMMILASALDLIIIYAGLELMALSVYVLTGFNKQSRYSNEAALKYVILSALSSCILLYGISLIYGLTGTTQLGALNEALGMQSNFDPLLVLGVVFLLSGFAFKVAAVPFHMWVPDVYQGAPTSITAFMSVGPKAVGFVLLIRIFLDALAPVQEIWLSLVIVIAIATMALGSLVALVQTNIKRMLAYSSIAHVGFALLGVVAGGAQGQASVMLYLLIYCFMNLGIFCAVILMKSNEFTGEEISDYTGLSMDHPGLALLMLIFLFSLAGIPPTAGFFAKFYIFVALIEQGYFALAVIAILFSAVAAFFYIRIIMLMYMHKPEQTFDIHLPLPMRVALGTTGIMVIYMGIFPEWFLSLAQLAAT